MCTAEKPIASFPLIQQWSWKTSFFELWVGSSFHMWSPMIYASEPLIWHDQSWEWETTKIFSPYSLLPTSWHLWANATSSFIYLLTIFWHGTNLGRFCSTKDFKVKRKIIWFSFLLYILIFGMTHLFMENGKRLYFSQQRVFQFLMNGVEMQISSK